MQHVTWMVTACVTRQPQNRSAKAALVKLPPFVTCCLRGTQHHPEEILTHLFLDGELILKTANCFRVDN